MRPLYMLVSHRARYGATCCKHCFKNKDSGVRRSKTNSKRVYTQVARSRLRREAAAEISDQLDGQVDTAEIRLAELDAATADDTPEWCEDHPLDLAEWNRTCIASQVPLDSESNRVLRANLWEMYE